VSSGSIGEAGAGANHPRLFGRLDYLTSIRIIKVTAFLIAAVFGGVLAGTVVNALARQWSLGPAATALTALVLAFLTADLLSGLVHFLCDNLGSPDTRLIGHKFIKSFRDHHVDPLEITRGDVITANGDAVLLCLPVLVPSSLWIDADENLFAASYVLSLVSFVSFTNEVHRRAHMPEPGRLHRWLQATGVVLTPARHRRHHTPPFDTTYCIVSGVLEPLLDRVGFWPRLLRLCHRIRR
jgi:sterol desaturase/sphingolipid hydroxylase (fatty acid hydroxylase superfamily)